MIMKTLNFLIAFVAWIGLSYAQDGYQSVAQTPTEIQNFVKTHFPNHQIVAYKLDKDDGKTEHEIKLNGGIDLEFDQNFKVKEIDSRTALPNSLLAKEIRDYISKNYPNAQVMEWKRKANGQKVELNNDVELYFDANGKFIRADH